MTDLLKLKRKVKLLRAKKQPPQRSVEWFKTRNTRITASEVASCLSNTELVCKHYVEEFNISNFKYDGKCCSHFDTREEYIIKKCRSFFGENVFKDSIFTLWGKKYEEIATRLYRQKYKTDIIEFGFLPHPRLKWIGASPDGITPNGIMLEIKCPFKRKIDGIVPFHYWMQMQMQLESTDLEMCHFLECELKEVGNEQEFLNYNIIENEQDKGILINKIDEEKNSETKYIYPPDNLITPESFIEWSNSVISQLKSENINAIPLYYIIHKWNVINVRRIKEWFINVKSDIKKTWELITRLQLNKDEFEKYKESIYLIKNKSFIEKYNNTICEITDDESIFVYDNGTNINDTVIIEENETENVCLID